MSISMPIAASLSRAISLVDLLRHAVDARAPGSVPFSHQVLSRQRLVGEAHVHHARRVALGGGQVDQAALAEQDQALVGGRARTPRRTARSVRRPSPDISSSALMLISSLKWPELAMIAPSFIAVEVRRGR